MDCTVLGLVLQFCTDCKGSMHTHSIVVRVYRSSHSLHYGNLHTISHIAKIEFTILKLRALELIPFYLLFYSKKLSVKRGL